MVNENNYAKNRHERKSSGQWCSKVHNERKAICKKENRILHLQNENEKKIPLFYSGSEE